MKKLIAMILCLMLCLPAASAFAGSEEREILTAGSFRYVVLNDGTAEIVKYEGQGEKPTIPERLDGWKVTSIGEAAFAECSNLTSIAIPDSVKSIGKYAFYSCKNLTSITLPDSVQCIGDFVFMNCSSLTSITLPDSAMSLGANPFASCEKLTSIMVSPDHPTLAIIDGVLFSKEDKRLVCYPCAFRAEAYSIPDGTRMIGVESFSNNKRMTSITIPGSVMCIEDNAFISCSNLTSITIPDSVTNIGGWAFAWCRSLISIAIPGSVTSIGDCAFIGCGSLPSITLPDSVTSIGDGAFAQCSASLKITVGRDSYASEYCKANNLKYTYPDINDWLKD